MLISSNLLSTKNKFTLPQGTVDCPDLDFIYDDADKQSNEIAELYSYTEGPEFQLNVKVILDIQLLLDLLLNGLFRHSRS